MKKSTELIALGGNSISIKGVSEYIEQQCLYERDAMDGLSIFILATIFV